MIVKNYVYSMNTRVCDGSSEHRLNFNQL